MFVNALYLLVVILTIKISDTNTKSLHKELRFAKKLTDVGVKFILGFVILIAVFKYFEKFKVKNCFVGSCFYDQNHIIYSQISPKYLEGK